MNTETRALPDPVAAECARLTTALRDHGPVTGFEPVAVRVCTSRWVTVPVPAGQIHARFSPAVIRFRDTWMLHPRIMQVIRPHLSEAAGDSLSWRKGWLGRIRGPAYLEAVTSAGIVPVPGDVHYVYLTAPDGLIGDRLSVAADRAVMRHGPDHVWLCAGGIVPWVSARWRVPPAGITAREWRQAVRPERDAA